MDKKFIILFLSVSLAAASTITIFAAVFLTSPVIITDTGDLNQGFNLSNNTNARCYGGYPWVEEEAYGRDVSLPTIYANNILNEIGYQSDYYLESDSSLMLTNMTNASVIYYIGHGCPSALCFDSSSCVIKNDISDFNDAELTDLDLAVYISFGSASDSDFGNIAYQTYEKGAKCVLGFTSELLMENSKKWSDYFMENLKENRTVYDSASLALWDETLYYGGETGNMEFSYIYGSKDARIVRESNYTNQESEIKNKKPETDPRIDKTKVSCISYFNSNLTILKEYGNWSERIYYDHDSWNAIRPPDSDFDKYWGFMGGPVTGCGIDDCLGGISIWWDPDIPVNETIMDEVYSLFCDSTKAAGMKEPYLTFIPVKLHLD